MSDEEEGCWEPEEVLIVSFVAVWVIVGLFMPFTVWPDWWWAYVLAPVVFASGFGVRAWWNQPERLEIREIKREIRYAKRYIRNIPKRK